MSDPGIIPANPSSSAVTPKEWNDTPSLTTLKITLSPTSMLIDGLAPDSPGTALNPKVLKSDASTNERSDVIVAPVCAAGPAEGVSPPIISTTGGGAEIQ